MDDGRCFSETVADRLWSYAGGSCRNKVTERTGETKPVSKIKRQSYRKFTGISSYKIYTKHFCPFAHAHNHCIACDSSCTVCTARGMTQ